MTRLLWLIVAGTASLWGQEPQLRTTLSGHATAVVSLAFSPDGKTLASGSRDQTIKLWDVATGKNTATLEGHTGDVTCVVFSATGKTLASGSKDKTIRLWDATTGKSILSLVHSETSEVSCVAFSPDGKTLASGGGLKGDPIRLWDVAAGTNISAFKHTAYNTSSVAFSPDGKTLASGHWGEKITLWNVGSGAPTDCGDEESKVGRREMLAFTTDGKTLVEATRCITEQVRLWDVANGKKIVALEGHDSRDKVLAVMFAPDSKIVSATYGFGEIKLWNTDTAKKTGFFKDQHKYSAAAYCPDGKSLAVGTFEDEAQKKTIIKVWDMEKFYRDGK